MWEHSISYTGLLWELNEMLHVKHLGQCLAYGKLSATVSYYCYSWLNNYFLSNKYEALDWVLRCSSEKTITPALQSRARSGKFLHEGPEGKYFRLCGTHHLSHNSSSLLLHLESSHIQDIKKKKKGMVVSQNLSSLPTPGLERTQIFKEAITIQRDKSSDRGSGE